MEVRLLVTHKKANTRQVRLGPETMIGRAPECQLRIASTEVSRRHCRIQITDRTICVSDLGSANGTFLNGQQIPSSLNVQIVNGDVLQIGPVQFVVECGDASMLAPAGADVGGDLSDTADDFENVRVISAEETSDAGSDDYPLGGALPHSGREAPLPIPLAGDDDLPLLSGRQNQSSDGDSGSIPGGATVYDRALPPLDRPSAAGGRSAGAAKPAGARPRSGEQSSARGNSSGTVKASKTPVPPGDDPPPDNLLGKLGLLGKGKSSGEVPTPPKRPSAPPPPRIDDDDLTLVEDSDATIDTGDVPNRKRPAAGKRTVSQFLPDDIPQQPPKKKKTPAKKPPPGQRSNQSIAESRDEDDQALADFLKGFDR